MSIKYYDDALLEKLRKWTKNTNVSIVSPDDTRRLFEMIEDRTNDEPIKLPIMALRRKPTFTVLNPNKRSLTFNGVRLSTGTGGVEILNAIPIQINYQIDIYTRYLSEADEYARNIIFNIINYPKAQVTLPYNESNYTHDFNIRMDNDVENNSDIPERLISGQFSRYSISIYVDDAYLWDTPIKPYKRISEIIVDPNPPKSITSNSNEAEIVNIP